MVPHGRAVPPRVLVDFLTGTLPFKDLEAAKLEDLFKWWVIDYYPRGTVILRQDVTEVKHVYVIQKGAVKVYASSSEASTLKDYRGEGSSFGAMSLLKDRKADSNVEAVEDTFCFLLEKDAFLSLVRSDTRFTRFFLQSFPDHLMSAAYSELRRQKVQPRGQESLHLFSTTVQTLIKEPPETISPSSTVQEAAALMAKRGIGSLLVPHPDGSVAGIITDEDLRSKVITRGLDYGTPVSEIMVSPVLTIPGRSLCFDVLLTMMLQHVDHLVVESDNDVRGVVTALDIMVYQGRWPIYLFREIETQRNIDGLLDLSRKVPMAVRSLIAEGAKAGDITQVITLLNDSILGRILDLVKTEIGPPPLPFCWLALGSEGRKEQTFRTDQDNALVFMDPANREEMHAAAVYFEGFAAKAVAALNACGYPPCKWEIMASNPRWRKPYEVWGRYFDEWLSAAEPREVFLSKVFFDFRPGYGHTAMGERLRLRLTDQAQRQPSFLAHLAGDCLQRMPPLSFLRNFVVETNGEYASRLDLKRRGIEPFVDFARVMALRHGIDETNTLGRMRLLSQNGHLSMDLFTEAWEAYEFQIQLVLVHQLRMVEAGLPPDSYIDPADLSDLERKTLKDAFGVIRRLQQRTREEFPMAR